MRLDHIAFRVADRHKAADFFCKCAGYRVVKEFEPKFSDGKTDGTKCLVLTRPPYTEVPRVITREWDLSGLPFDYPTEAEYHLAPEIFISDGPKTSIVGKWVKEHGPGIHHMALEVDDVEKTMESWQSQGYAEFSSDVIKCPGLEQVFTKPSEITGVIIELIHRDKDGFCEDSVGKLMESTNELGR